MSQPSLNLFFVIDKNYVPHFTVTLTSLLENNRDLKIQVFLIHDIEEDERLDTALRYFKKRYHLRIISCPADPALVNRFPTSDYISRATYFKFLLAELVPSDIDKGLYLDSDLLITGSLAEFVNPDFYDPLTDQSFGLLAAGDLYEEKEKNRLEQKGVTLNGYFNAGVMAINLAKWREEKLASKLIWLTEESRELIRWHDQDVLNIYFKHNWKRINSTYNTFSSQHRNPAPVIIHFGGLPKPWHYISSDYYKPLYRKYLRITPFKNERFDTRSFRKIARKYWRYYKKRLRPRTAVIM